MAKAVDCQLHDLHLPPADTLPVGYVIHWWHQEECPFNMAPLLGQKSYWISFSCGDAQTANQLQIPSSFNLRSILNG